MPKNKEHALADFFSTQGPTPDRNIDLVLDPLLLMVMDERYRMVLAYLVNHYQHPIDREALKNLLWYVTTSAICPGCAEIDLFLGVASNT